MEALDLDNAAAADVALRAQDWVRRFGAAVDARDWAGAASGFAADSHWRDLIAFTWDFGTTAGPEGVRERFAGTFDVVRPSGFRISDRHSAPTVAVRNGRTAVDVHLTFETTQGDGVALVRLVPEAGSPSGLAAWLMLTKLHGVRTRPALDRPGAPDAGFTPGNPRETWLDVREAERAFADREPEVLVVGAGHAGLFVAAHLRRLAVDALVVDAHPRVGDNWRTRYRSLTLHNKVNMNQFPYLRYPESFPDYLPRDKFANWIEGYAESIEANIWTSTRFEGGSYDEATGTWEVTVRRADGSPRILRPRHVVMATGGFGSYPRIPELPGLDTFAGEIGHTQTFRSGPQHAGKRALVIGVGTSAHDIALELYRDGADVTMLQRGSTTVVSLDGANAIWTTYNDGTPLDEADLKGSLGFIRPIFLDTCRRVTDQNKVRDASLREGLAAAGLRLDDGDDGTGWLYKFYAQGGGYYFNVGASDVIIDGGIRILQAAELETVIPGGVRLNDGSTSDFDVIVFGTAYENRQEENRVLFGDAVAQAVGPIGGFDETNEVRNVFRPTAQRGLWFMFGGILAARQHSPLVALQIAAELDHISPRDRSDSPVVPADEVGSTA